MNKKQRMAIKPLTWVQIRWNDAPDEVALVLHRDGSEFDIMVKGKKTWVTDSIELDQVVRVLGMFSDDDVPSIQEDVRTTT